MEGDTTGQDVESNPVASGLPSPGTPPAPQVPTPPPIPPEPVAIVPEPPAPPTAPNPPQSGPVAAPAAQAAPIAPSSLKVIRSASNAQKNQQPPQTGVSEDEIRNDIARILAEAQLPERRSVPGAVPVAPSVTPQKEATILEEKITKNTDAPSAEPPVHNFGTTVMPQKTDDAHAAPAQTAPPAPQGVVPPPSPPPTAPASSSPEHPHVEHSSAFVTPLRTLKDDLQAIVREKKVSLVHAVALEEDKKAKKPPSPERTVVQTRTRRRIINVLFASAIFVALGGAAIFGVIYVVNQKASVPTAVPQSSLLFAENTVTFALDGSGTGTLKSQLADARTKQIGSLGSIIRILPTFSIQSTGGNAARPATLSEFFTALGINPPDELMRAIGPDFFFGIHSVDKNAPLFIIPVTSYDHAFAGMLAWEKTMNADLTPIFTAVPATKMSAAGVPEARTFQDVVMRIYDARALEDDDGTIELYYSFPTPNILVIAESPFSFGEILSRLQAERKL